MRWDFFVRHYADDAQQRRDGKCGPHGILYPRAGTLGGCTAHNAMILVAPHDTDWDGIAALTGDPSWRAADMRRYWRRLENCRYRPLWRRLARYGIDPTGHGWAGWLDSEYALPQEAMRDDDLVRLVLGSARAASLSAANPLRSLRTLIFGAADPNDRRFGRGGFEGVCYTPLSTQRTSASAPASGCSMSPRAIRTGCGSSCTRSRPASCSTSGTARPASSIWPARTSIAPTRQPRRKRRRLRGGSPRGARSSSPAAPSTRRSC